MQALNRLDSLEGEIKSLSLSRNKDTIARQHADFASRVQELTQPALAQGRAIVERIGRGVAGARGVEYKVQKAILILL